jgi:hypothetical protein
MQTLAGYQDLGTAGKLQDVLDEQQAGPRPSATSTVGAHIVSHSNPSTTVADHGKQNFV